VSGGLTSLIARLAFSEQQPAQAWVASRRDTEYTQGVSLTREPGERDVGDAHTFCGVITPHGLAQHSSLPEEAK